MDGPVVVVQLGLGDKAPTTDPALVRSLPRVHRHHVQPELVPPPKVTLANVATENRGSAVVERPFVRPQAVLGHEGRAASWTEEVPAQLVESEPVIGQVDLLEEPLGAKATFEGRCGVLFGWAVRFPLSRKNSP